MPIAPVVATWGTAFVAFALVRPGRLRATAFLAKRSFARGARDDSSWAMRRGVAVDDCCFADRGRRVLRLSAMKTAIGAITFGVAEAAAEADEHCAPCMSTGVT
jgi:hypothetical protein